MTIELTAEQADAIATEGDAVVVVDPRTRQVYRLVREEDFQAAKAQPDHESEWTTEESAILAGIAFEKLDDTDYSSYLQDVP